MKKVIRPFWRSNDSTVAIVASSILALTLFPLLVVRRQYALHLREVGVPMWQQELLALLHRFPLVQLPYPGLLHLPKGLSLIHI